MDGAKRLDVTVANSAAESRHRWYYFKEGFSSTLVDYVIKQTGVGPGSRIVDPFCGSGTTVLTATANGIRSAGKEVNPFLRFVSRCKTSTVAPMTFRRAVAGALDGAASRKVHPLELFSTFSERGWKSQRQQKWLFNSAVLRAFWGSWSRLKKKDATGDLVRLCLLGAAMDAANAAKDGKCLRYRPDWESLDFGRSDFVDAAIARSEIIAEDLERSPLSELAVVELADSRVTDFGECFDLCVTSPPYLNSFDYTDVYRPELFLGGFVSTMDELTKLRLSTLRSHIQVDWPNPEASDFGLNYAKAISDLRSKSDTLWDHRLPRMIQAYFEDMQSVLTILRAKANRNAVVALVVSTSAYAGSEIPVDLIIADIAVKSGWQLREVSVLRQLKRVAGQQWHSLSSREGIEGPHLRESMVVLDAVNTRHRR